MNDQRFGGDRHLRLRGLSWRSLQAGEENYPKTSSHFAGRWRWLLATACLGLVTGMYTRDLSSHNSWALRPKRERACWRLWDVWDLLSEATQCPVSGIPAGHVQGQLWIRMGDNHTWTSLPGSVTQGRRASWEPATSAKCKKNISRSWKHCVKIKQSSRRNARANYFYKYKVYKHKTAIYILWECRQMKGYAWNIENGGSYGEGSRMNVGSGYKNFFKTTYFFYS